MKKLFLLAPAIMLLAFIAPIKDLYVQLGAAKQTMEQAPYASPDVVRVYFDRMGFIYPDYVIPDAKLRDDNYSMLRSYYYNNPATYGYICSYYGVHPKADIENLQPDNDPLQRAIIDGLAKRINDKGRSYSKLVYLIHGFNKEPMGDDGAEAQFRELSSRLASLMPSEKILYVEVYWDGCYDRGSRANAVKMWDNAQLHSCNVGLELRRLLNHMDRQQVYVLTHSLGASVITTALFNVEKFRGTPETNADLYFQKHYDDTTYQTPSYLVKVGMLAPAIPGDNTFDDYYKRTNRPQQMGYNNYRFVVGFNHNDQVLEKFIGSPAFLGSTTLGCSNKEIYKFVTRFNKDVCDTTDFCYLPNGAPQYDHSLTTYANNTAFNRFANNVFTN